jgi:hypothetical protein
MPPIIQVSLVASKIRPIRARGYGLEDPLWIRITSLGLITPNAVASGEGTTT